MTPFDSISDYEHQIYDLPNKYPHIQYSTLVLKRPGQHIAEVVGTIFFEKNIRLNIKELIDFRRKRIKTYSYEVYHDRDKHYWYDDQPHPDDASLQSTFPHHKHIHPDIKHHRLLKPTPLIVLLLLIVIVLLLLLLRLIFQHQLFNLPKILIR